MTVYLQSSALPVTIEYPMDSLDAVRDAVFEWIGRQHVEFIDLDGHGTIVVNWAAVGSVFINPTDPESLPPMTDEEKAQPKPRVSAVLGRAGWTPESGLEDLLRQAAR